VVAVVFTPSGRRGEFEIGTPLLEAARQLGVDIDSVCGGRGLCGRCQILCTSGSFAKHGIESSPSHLSPISQTEIKYSERKTPLEVGRRLSCHTRIEGPLVIDVPAESQVHKQVVRKDAEQRDISLDPNIRLHYIEVPEDEMEHSISNVRRMLQALENQWQLTNLTVDGSIFAMIHQALIAGKNSLTVAISNDGYKQRVIAVFPGFTDQYFGLAIDIGSTTIALHLTDMNSGDVLASVGCMNPQIRFGEDLMSRVSYLQMHPEGTVEMTEVVRDAINQLIDEAAEAANIDKRQILSMVAAGNPIMHHLVLGIDPSPLGFAPFTLATDDAIEIAAREVDLQINPGGRLYLPPCIAGHVGADTAAVLLSEQPYKGDSLSLMIDIGTNAEIVLGNQKKLLACSSPTGPAFEGAQISCGQRAAPGAIERVRIDPKTLDVRVRVIGSEFWSDEPGFTDSIVNFGITGICGSGIIEAVAEMYLAGVLSTDGVIQAKRQAESDRILSNGRTFSFLLTDGDVKVSVTQNDVRQIQLAKAALYAGVKLLMDRFPTDHVDEIKIAGAFGSNIDAKYAMLLGLIPDCALAQVASVGNAASTGARIALLNDAARAEIQTVVRQIEKIETAVAAEFQSYFVDAMAIPHKTDPFVHLFKVVNKPAQAAEEDTQRKRRGRRKRD